MPAFPRPSGFRAFSALSKTRAAIRSMEPHPFSRPVAQLEAAKGDWSKPLKQAATTTAFFLPTMVAFLSWPYLSGKALNGHM